MNQTRRVFQRDQQHSRCEDVPHFSFPLIFLVCGQANIAKLLLL
jgi:hypothetical protein